jgi:hypothetical protein
VFTASAAGAFDAQKWRFHPGRAIGLAHAEFIKKPMADYPIERQNLRVSQNRPFRQIG